MCFGQRANKRAAEQQARDQVTALENAAKQEAEQNKQAALAASQQIQQMTARQAVEAQAAEIVSVPLETAEVVLPGVQTDSEAAKRRKRVQSYGSGDYSSGVSI